MDAPDDAAAEGLSPLGWRGGRMALERVRAALADAAAETAADTGSGVPSGVAVGIVGLIGPPGSGRTSVLAALAEGRPPLPAREVAAVLAASSSAAGETGRDMLRVDDADALDAATLQRLAVRPGGAVLAGGPALATRLLGLPMGCRLVHLPPLARDELDGFVAARLARAGLAMPKEAAGLLEGIAAESGLRPGAVVRLVEEAADLASVRPASAVPPPPAPVAAVRHPMPPPITRPPPVVGSPALTVLFDPPPSATPVSYRELPRRGRTAAVALALVAATAILVATRGVAPEPRAPVAMASLTPAPLPEPAVPPLAAAPSAPPITVTPDQVTPVAPAPAPATSVGPSPDPAAPAHPVAPTADAAPPQAKQASAPTSVALPESAPLRIVLTYPTGDAAARERADAQAKQLRALGFDVADPTPADNRNAAITYYFAEDRDGAARVVRVLGGGVPRQAPMPATLPPPGTIEVSVAEGH